MELRQIRYFLAVADHLHYSRAALQLGIEQSPLSRAIRDLECEIGVQLFDRTSRGTRLTSAGESFLDDARRVLASAEQAQRAAQELACGHRGRLRIGIADAIAQPRFSQLVAEFRAAHPHAACAISTMAPSEQVEALLSDCVDVGISLDATKVNHIVSEPLWREDLVAVLPADHPLATEPRFDLSPLTSDRPRRFAIGTLLPVTVFTGSQSPGLRDVRVVPQHVPNVLTLLTLVSAGLGVGLMTAGIATTIHRPDVIFRPLSHDACAITVSLLRRDTRPSPLVEHFILAARAGIRRQKATARVRSSGASVLNGSLDRAQ